MKILVSKRANKDFLKILKYLEYNWALGSVEKFKSITNDFLDILESFPEIWALEFPEKNIRGFQLTSQTRVFFNIKPAYILILAFFDVWQNPKSRNF
ncbi:ParE toxin of type II toxin-antitoxin system, parDE [Algoriphagus alkaliphilus]|uniref:ParE toxin of type II toxin-antitoxin system, parDE n=1 Tax=Algoriphagus alkaliphilus TaxID=279824 RepID=A0A1G5Z0K8_9BACT|nr:ParE toxin of type II toxin-antitoxin system, parDE [Algoriphagus alkaliphilus]